MFFRVPLLIGALALPAGAARGQTSSVSATAAKPVGATVLVATPAPPHAGTPGKTATSSAAPATSSGPTAPRPAALAADPDSSVHHHHHARFGLRWIFDHLKLQTLVEDNGPADWIIALITLLVAVGIGRAAAVVLSRVGLRMENRGWSMRGHVFAAGAGPAKLLGLTMGLSLGAAQLLMNPAQRLAVNTASALLYYIAIFWYLYALVAAVDVVLQTIATRTGASMDKQVVPMIRKIIRLVLLVIAALVIAQSVFRQDVGAWLAGLGIAGLAVSLAAQDSLKNFFGAMTIFFDRTYVIGDFVQVGDTSGTVEDIGFRSTRLRGSDGRLMTVPNLNMVGQTVENISRRNFLFRKLDVTITCDTPVKKIEQAVRIIRDILAEPGIAEPLNQPVAGGAPRPPRVYFEKTNADNLSIGVWYWYVPADWWAYMEHTQRVNLRLIEEFGKAGIEFAFPTQMLYHADDPKRKLTVAVDANGKTEAVAAARASKDTAS